MKRFLQLYSSTSKKNLKIYRDIVLQYTSEVISMMMCLHDLMWLLQKKLFRRQDLRHEETTYTRTKRKSVMNVSFKEDVIEMSDRKIFHSWKATYIHICLHLRMYSGSKEIVKMDERESHSEAESSDCKTHVLTLLGSGRIIVFYEHVRSWFVPTDLINVSSEERVSMIWRTINSHKSGISFVYCTTIFSILSATLLKSLLFSQNIFIHT